MKDMQLIHDLMCQLQEAMGYDGDELEERLGRKKPGVEIEIEGEMPMEKAEEMVGKDLDHDMEMGEDPEHVGKVLGDEMDFDDEEGMFKPKSEGMELKKRLMAIRGK